MFGPKVGLLINKLAVFRIPRASSYAGVDRKVNNICKSQLIFQDEGLYYLFIYRNLINNRYNISNSSAENNKIPVKPRTHPHLRILYERYVTFPKKNHKSKPITLPKK